MIQRKSNPDPITTSGELDPTGHHYRRRMSEQKLEQWANSAVLKILQYIVTAVALPVITWAMSTALDRLKNIEDGLTKANMQAALFEQRLQAVERSQASHDAKLNVLTEQSMKNSFEIQRLDARRNP